MISIAKRIPNFAGVALVDILANGVAVLIIVIVLSIASRTEQEQHYNERIQEISTAMAREFSTSLILNRLAAGPPSLLHDYENSPLDLIWDPAVMPVLEFHTNVVRNPYSGQIWTKSELLQEPNSLDLYLATLNPQQKAAMRGDIYDVGTYYLLVSILKDHQITIAHWHFLSGNSGGVPSDVGSCPAGMSAKDCTLGERSLLEDRLPSLYESLTDDDARATDQGKDAWPPEALALADSQEGGQAGSNSALPQGSELGASQVESTDYGSFPDARDSRARLMGSPGSERSGLREQGSPGLSIRLADPTAQALPLDAFNLGAGEADLESFLIALMSYLSDVQTRIDNQEPPTVQLQQFVRELEGYMEEPVSLTEAELFAVEDLALTLEWRRERGLLTDQPEPLLTAPLPPTAHPEALIRTAMNRILVDVEVQSNNALQLEALPEEARVRFNLQAYPDVWRGIRIVLERNAVILISPEQTEPLTPKWRTIAYLSPQLDDFIVGFVYSRVTDGNQLELIAPANRGIVSTVPLEPVWDSNPFSTQTWMMAIYLLAGGVLVALSLFWRPGNRFGR